MAQGETAAGEPAEAERTVDVVITGMAGKFPCSSNTDELCDNLFNKVNMVKEENCKWKTNNKWNVPSATGNIDGVYKFDHAQFGIHHKQVLSLDPMTRLVMERSFEAVCDAGLSLADLKGSNTGVYMSSTHGEGEMMFDYEVHRDGFGVLGQNRSMLSTRISYFLDVSGPSFVAETSWCGGLSMLTLAFRDIKSGRCDSAIVGAPSLTLFPEMSWHMMQTGKLSPDAKCKAFDEKADGYGRGEAIVVLFLQKSTDARRVYASIVHSEANCYGGRLSFAHTSQISISQMLSNFYLKCRVNPADVVYLEADGTGIKKDDEAELNAVDIVMLQNRTTPLLIGSVKSNLGHTEAASSLVSVVKVLLAMEAGYIPPNLHYTSPALGIPALTEGRLQVVTEKTPWPGGLAAINSFGMDGNYGHILLKSFDKKKKLKYEGVPRLITISGRTEEGLQKSFSKMESLTCNTEYIRLIQDVFVNNIAGHLYRGFAIAEPKKNKTVQVERFNGEKRPVWLVFSGMGSQWPGMGKHLLQLPIFKAAVVKSHAILKPRGLDLINILTDTDPAIFENILHCFVGIAAVQIGLMDVLRALNISPDGLIGHSVGELGCAYADGCLTAEEMILAAYARGRASLEAKLVKGTMAAVGLGFSQIKDMLPSTIEVACHNGPESCTISGPCKDIEDFVAELTLKGIFARSVNVANIAYHSQYIAPAAPRLLEFLKEIIPTPKARSSRWISTSIPEDEWDCSLARTSSAEYHTNNLLNCVLFEEGSRHIPKDAITIEVAPHGLLQAILRRSLGPSCSNVALTQRGHQDGMEVLLTSIGKLYLLGLQPKVSALYPPVSYPVSTGTPPLSPIIDWDHREEWNAISVIKTNLIAGEREVVLYMSQEKVRTYAGNSVNGHILFPEAGYLELVWETFASINQTQMENTAVSFEEVRFHKMAYVPEKGSLTLYLMVQRGTGAFEVLNKEDKTVLATGRVYIPEILDREFLAAPVINETALTKLTSDDIYTEFEQRGYQYSNHFRGITSATIGGMGSVCETQWQNNWVAFMMLMVQQGLLLLGEEMQNVQIPESIQKLVIDPKKHLQGGHQATIEVLCDVTAGIIQGGGIQIQGLKTRSVTETSESSQPALRLDTLKFVPYKNSRLQSVKDFVDVCVQIAVENSKSEVKANSNVTVIKEDNLQSLVTVIEECVNKYPHMEMSIKCPCSGELTSLEKKSGSFLVVTNSSFLDHSIMYLEKTGGFILTRIETVNPWKFRNDLIIITEQEFGTEKFLLLKKVVSLYETAPVVIQVSKGDKLWINKLRTTINKKRQEIILVSEEEPQVGVASFKDKISKEPGSECIRYVFILDSDLPKFSLADKFYQDQLDKKLVVNIYQDKGWGSLRQLSLGKNLSASRDKLTFPIPSLLLDGIQLNYLGLNKKDLEESNDQCELGHVDFTGRTSNSRCVMGIARCGQTKPDPYLTWQVPEAFGMDEAATIPFAYATAYYALILTAKLEKDHSVLIHEGCSSIGQAAIAIALDMGCTVFTTVANQEQHNALILRFPQLRPSNIYSSKNSTFEIRVRLATNSRGVQVILNSLSGKQLQASLRCLSSFSCFLQLGRKDLSKNTSIGMLVFNSSRAFYGIAADNLFNACQEWKERLHDLVQDGIARGVVLPLDHRVFSHQQYHRALGMLTDTTQWNKVLLNVREANRDSNYLQAEIIPRLQFDSEKSFLIVGGKTDQWLDMADWLLQRGATSLVIAQAHPITNYISRRVELLRKYRSAVITLAAADEAETISGAEKLVKLANEQGQLTAIFMLPLIEKTRKTEENGSGLTCSLSSSCARNLDRASRSTTVRHFVCLLFDGADNVCWNRQRAGHPSLAVQWDCRQTNCVTLRPVLGSLDRMLCANENHAFILCPASRQTNTPSAMPIEKSRRLDTFLPSSVEDLVKLGSELVSSASMEEVASISPGLRDVKEVPPVFLLPGLHGASNDVLHPLASRLMYPAICVKLPRGGQTLRGMAKDIAQNVRAIQPSGPYNLVGDLWSGALVLEITQMLEADGQKAQVFILEGAPETSKSTLRELGSESNMDTNLICRLLNISSNVVKEELNGLHTWKSKLKHGLNTIPRTTATEACLIETAVGTVRSHIHALLQHEPAGPQLTSLVTLVRPLGEEEHDCGLIKFCKNTVTIHLIGKDHLSLLSSSQTRDIICDNVIL